MLRSSRLFAQSDDEAAVLQAVEALRNAMLDADRARLEELVADQLSYGHSSGTIQTKAQFVDVIVNKETIYKSIALSEPMTVVAGDDAIVRHVMAVESETGGKSATTKIGVLQVWVKQGGRWKLLARQAFKSAEARRSRLPDANITISSTATKQGERAMAKFTWDHINLRTTDPEAMAQWFEKTLGAEVLRTMQQGKPRIDLKIGGANIFIAPVAPGDRVNAAPTTPYRGLDHFGLAVTGIDAIAADLKAKGVEFTREPTTIRPGVRVCFIRGPEGVSIELLDRNVN